MGSGAPGQELREVSVVLFLCIINIFFLVMRIDRLSLASQFSPSCSWVLQTPDSGGGVERGRGGMKFVSGIPLYLFVSLDL